MKGGHIMAKIDEIRTLFSDIEGFHFREDIRHNLTDVTLPHDYELISKQVNNRLLQRIEFRDNKGNHFVFEN